MALGVFSRLLLTMNVHRQRSTAREIELRLLLAVVDVSYAFVFVAVVLLMRIHCQEYPARYKNQISSNVKSRGSFIN